MAPLGQSCTLKNSIWLLILNLKPLTYILGRLSTIGFELANIEGQNLLKLEFYNEKKKFV